MKVVVIGGGVVGLCCAVSLVERGVEVTVLERGPDGATHTGWAGLRPATPDSLPFLGPVDGAPGLVVAVGHGMLGVTLAPATGNAVAEMLVTGRVSVELAPFRIGRRI